MTKLFFVKARIRPEGLQTITTEVEVAKETEKQFQIGKRAEGMPCVTRLNKSDLGNLKTGHELDNYYVFCLEENTEDKLKECILRLQSDLQRKYDRLFPLLKPMKEAKYPIKELK